MLSISVKPQEWVQIGDIRVTYRHNNWGKIQLVIDAPPDVLILRPNLKPEARAHFVARCNEFADRISECPPVEKGKQP